MSFGINEEGSSTVFLWNKGKNCGVQCLGLQTWVSLLVGVCPTGCTQPPSAAPLSWEQGHFPDSSCPSALLASSNSPLILTMLVCTHMCTFVLTCTPVCKQNVFLGSSFDIWFSIHFLLIFVIFFSSFISYQSCYSSNILNPCFSRFLPTPLIKLLPLRLHFFFSFFFFFITVISIQQAFSECWARARFGAKETNRTECLSPSCSVQWHLWSALCPLLSTLVIDRSFQAVSCQCTPLQ